MPSALAIRNIVAQSPLGDFHHITHLDDAKVRLAKHNDLLNNNKQTQQQSQVTSVSQRHLPLR
jgi:hypothetical protein